MGKNLIIKWISPTVVVIWLPEIIINPHTHGRDLLESYKITIKQLLLESWNFGSMINGFMPNTKDPITTVAMLEQYLGLIEIARIELGIPHPQYIWMGAIDGNGPERVRGLQHPWVLGTKIYPRPIDGPPVTTGTIGVSSVQEMRQIMREDYEADKVVCRHCDHPLLIKRSGGNPIITEVADLKLFLSCARHFPGIKIYVPHVSCCESFDLIRRARDKGINVMAGISVHYLFFDNEGTNWAPGLDQVFYKCFNAFRGPEHRQYLEDRLLDESDLIIAEGDSASHTEEEKLAGGLKSGPGGLPTHQHFLAGFVTKAIERGMDAESLGKILSWNASRFFNIPTPQSYQAVTFELRKDDFVLYNNGIVMNPWQGVPLWFPQTALAGKCDHLVNKT